MKALFEASRHTWKHTTRHSINDGEIIAAGPVKRYNPWQYAEQVKLPILAPILGSKEFRPMPMYLAFANIDTENTERIIAWCNQFGFPEPGDGSYSLALFQKQVEQFRALCQMAGTMKQKAGIEPALLAGINEHTRETKFPEFQLDESGEIAKVFWREVSLLCIMHFMLVLALTNGIVPQICGNATCQNLYSQDRSNQAFCCHECKNLSMQRRFQQKKRALQSEGATSEGGKDNEGQH